MNNDNPSQPHCVLQPFVMLLSQRLLDGLYKMWSMSKGKTKVKVVLSFTNIAGLPLYSPKENDLAFTGTTWVLGAFCVGQLSAQNLGIQISG